MTEVESERFHPTSGQFMGWLTMVVAALALGTAVAYGVWEVALGAALAGVLAWASMLRPRLLIEGGELVMRNMLETVRIPLAAIRLQRAEPEPALRHATRAIAECVDTGHRLGLARAHLIAGHALRRLDDESGGETHLAAAHELFADIGADADLHAALLLQRLPWPGRRAQR